MFEIPKTKNPSKWDKNEAVNRSDFQSNQICGEDINDIGERLGVKPKFNFQDGKAVNLETGDTIDL